MCEILMVCDVDMLWFNVKLVFFIVVWRTSVVWTRIGMEFKWNIWIVKENAKENVIPTRNAIISSCYGAQVQSLEIRWLLFDWTLRSMLEVDIQKWNGTIIQKCLNLIRNMHIIITQIYSCAHIHTITPKPYSRGIASFEGVAELSSTSK